MLTTPVCFYRQQQANAELDSVSRDVNTAWLDPMPEPGERHFAQDLRSIAAGRKAGEVPEWKRETFNKATSFGRITNMSIKEQRESLPIFKLRSQLIQAISDVSTLILLGGVMLAAFPCFGDCCIILFIV